MADFSQNVSNTVRAFGGGGASLWNAYNWNAFNWGEGTVPFQFFVVHQFDSGGITAGSSYLGFSVQHSLDNQSVGSDTSITNESVFILGSNSITMGSETVGETLGDGSGYNYVFRSNTTDGENRFTPTWTQPADDSESWTTSSDPSTTWS